VRESLRLLAEQDREKGLAHAQAKIASGLAQARRGQLRDGERVFAEQRGRLLKKLNRS
jgi:hypothetical protein